MLHAHFALCLVVYGSRRRLSRELTLTLASLQRVAPSDRRHDVSIVACAYAWVTMLPRYKQFEDVMTFLLAWRAWKRLMVKRRRWKGARHSAHPPDDTNGF